MNVRPLLLLLVIAACGCARGGAAPVVPRATSAGAISAAGLVEPAGEERVLIPEIGGRLARVLIEEGDSVKAGQVLAELDNAEYAASLAMAEAQVAQRESQLLRLRNGARAEERAQARAELAGADAALRLALGERDRRRSMLVKQQVSREVADQAEANFDAASANRDAAAARAALLDHGARVEDISIAQAELTAATAEAARAHALLEKTRIRAPIDGVVLKRDLREGETVVALSPIPLARIGDVSRLYVRADVDELDISRVRTGLRAEISADAIGDKRYGGVVVRVSQRMGKRNSSSESPTEKIDAKILEVMVQLDADAHLPIGLRVDVRIFP